VSTVPVFAPTGELGDIPAERLADAVKAGFKPGVHVQSADGKDGVIPAARTADAVKAGMKIVPIQDQPIKHPGFWSTLSNDLVGMVSGAYHGIVDYDPLTDPNLPDSQKNAIVTAQQNAASAQNQARTQAHGRAYSLGATAAEMVGTNVSGMEQSAEQGDVGGVMGHAAAVPTALATTEILGRGLPAATKFATSKARAIFDVLPKDLQQEVVGVASPRLRSAIRLWNGFKELNERTAAPAVNPGAPYPQATPEQLNPSLVSPARTLPGMNAPEVTGRPTPGPIQGPGRGLMLPGEVAATGKLSDLVAAPSAERIPAVRDPSTILPRLRAIAQQIEEQEAKAKVPADLSGEVQGALNQVIDNRVLGVLGKEGKGLQVSMEALQRSPELSRFTPQQLQESAVRLRDAGKVWRQEIGGGAHAVRYVVSLK
jgi:hypothetical protein